MYLYSHIIFQANGQNTQYEIGDTDVLQSYIDAKGQQIATVVVFLIFYKAVIKFEISKLIFCLVILGKEQRCKTSSEVDHQVEDGT